MGVIIPQVVSKSTTSGSGAQVIDGSLKFDDNKTQFLEKTFASAGNRKTWTYSAWFKRGAGTSSNNMWAAYNGSFSGLDNFGQNYWAVPDGRFVLYQNGGAQYTSAARHRDHSGGWYHLVIACDVTQSSYADRYKVYVNNVLNSSSSGTIAQNTDLAFNNNIKHYIGTHNGGGELLDGNLSQVYFIDGQALGPGYFGFTDPLTGTWKPRKRAKQGAPTVNDGTVWSNAVPTADGFRPGRAAADGFDGDLTTYVALNNTTFNLDVGSWGISGMMEVYTGANHKYAVDGSSASDMIADGWTTVGDAGSISTLTFTRTDGNYPYFYAIRVDGVILLDSTTTTFDFGTNGFYLPLDGNSPIGQDKSGKGNDWTPVNFGGSVALDNPQVSGARPILNTTQGGAQAGVGVFGSKQNVGYAVTVYNDGGGNKYYIDGVKQDTVTGLIRGATYTFDTSDSTVSSHPFRFSATSNGSHGGGSEYTNGVAAITGAATTITVPHDAPNTLYYYCTSHSGMGADITGITTNEKLADQYASHVTFALPLISNSGDVSTSIACTSSTKAITSNGTVAASTVQSNFYGGSFVFDGDSDYFTFAPGGDFAFGTADFTVECWCYSINRGEFDYIIDGRNSGQTTGTWTLGYGYAGGNGRLEFASGSSTLLECPAAHNPEAGRWFHVAVARSGTSLKMFIDGVEVTSATNSTNFSTSPSTSYIGTRYSQQHYWDGYMQDIRVYKGVAKYTSDFVVPSRSPDILPDTPSGVSGGSKLTKITDGAVTFGGSATSKLTLADSTDFTFGTNDFCIEFYYYNNSLDGTYDIIFDCMGSNRSGIQLAFETDGDYRIEVGDGSNNWIWQSTGFDAKENKWTHFALTREGSTFRAFEDGVLLGTQTSSTAVGDPRSPAIGGWASDDSTNYGFYGFISNFRIVNGSAVYTAAFTPPSAPLTNVTNTKLLCCQSPTITTAAAVTPGSITSAGDAAATTFNPFNTDINTVRGQETGYCTLNPLKVSGSNANKTSATLSNGNLTSTNPASNAFHCRVGTIGVDSGKWFYEYTMSGTITGLLGGWADPENLNFQDGVGNTGRSYGYYATGNVRNSNNNTGFGASYTTGDVIGCAIDLDNYKIYWSKNGVWQNGAVPAAGTGSIYTVTSGYKYFPAVSTYDSSSSVTVNFGQKPFKFPPPDGFQPLNTANTRPETVISRPDQYVGVATHTGTGSAQKISLPFQADLIWSKTRSHSVDHKLVDSVGGFTKVLESNQLRAYSTVTTGVTGANFNGFTIGNSSDYNTSGRSYVSWCWKAGGNKNTFNVDDVGYASASAAGITDGTISLTGCSVGTKQGFSILKYAGSGSNGTLAHGLSQAPDFFFGRDVEDTGGSRDWIIYHKSIGATGRLKFTETDGTSTSSTFFQDTSPTNSLITVGTSNDINSTNDYILYCWHDVPGLQKFGKYSGSGSSGNFIELGFRPALLMIKSTGAYGWAIVDTTRSDYNVKVASLYPNKSDAEYTGSGHEIDYLSNGFNLRNSNDRFNKSSTDYIYAAWAEAPSIDLYGGGANAR